MVEAILPNGHKFGLETLKKEDLKISPKNYSEVLVRSHTGHLTK
jgi:hypothetical protein